MKRLWVCGMQSVRQLLREGVVKIEQIVVMEAKRHEVANVSQQYSVKVEKKAFFEKMFPGQVHQGVAVHCAVEEYSLQAITSDQTIQKIVLIDQVQDLRNIGAIIRSAAAFGFQAILASVDAHCPDVYAQEAYSQIFKAAAGGMSFVKLVSIGNVSSSIDFLKKQNFWVIGLDEQGGELASAKNFDKTCLIVGQEGRGLRELTKKKCDLLCSIRTSANFGCLNAGIAAAIGMYELSD